MKKLRLRRFFVMALMINSMSMYGMLVRTQQAQRAAAQRAAVQRGANSNQLLPSRQYSVKPTEQKPASEASGGWFSNWWSRPSQQQESVQVKKPSWFSELWYGKKVEPVQVEQPEEQVSGALESHFKKQDALEKAKQRRKELSEVKKQKKELENELETLKSAVGTMYGQYDGRLSGHSAAAFRLPNENKKLDLMGRFMLYDAKISEIQKKLASINAKLSQTGRQKSLSVAEKDYLESSYEHISQYLKESEAGKNYAMRTNIAQVILTYDFFNDPIYKWENELAIVKEKLSRAKASERRQLERE